MATALSSTASFAISASSVKARNYSSSFRFKSRNPLRCCCPPSSRPLLSRYATALLLSSVWFLRNSLKDASNFVFSAFSIDLFFFFFRKLSRSPPLICQTFWWIWDNLFVCQIAENFGNEKFAFCRIRPKWWQWELFVMSDGILVKIWTLMCKCLNVRACSRVSHDYGC